jgi:hypothetical protein
MVTEMAMAMAMEMEMEMEMAMEMVTVMGMPALTSATPSAARRRVSSKERPEHAVHASTISIAACLRSACRASASSEAGDRI